MKNAQNHHISVDQDTYTIIRMIADQKGVTEKSIVRTAVQKTYAGEKAKKNNTRTILDTIDRLAKRIDTAGINYRQIIHAGHHR